MGARSGLALKALQWFIRGVQFCCAAIVLAIFSYFLATLHNHDLPVATWIRAVEGISGVATLYTLTGLLLLFCLAGHPFSSGVAVILDVAFVGAFIYVASSNRGGAGSCEGIVRTPFGTGNADTNVVDDGHGGFTALPSFRRACQLETACLSVSIVAIFFFIFSLAVEVALVRHRRREQRFGPSPANGYTTGYGSAPGPAKRRGLFFWRRGRIGTMGSYQDPNQLPEHTSPDQVRDSYATEATTAVGSHPPGSSAGYSKTGGAGAAGGEDYEMVNTTGSKYGNTNPYTGRPVTPTTPTQPQQHPYGNPYGQQQPQPPGYRYGDGVYDA